MRLPTLIVLAAILAVSSRAAAAEPQKTEAVAEPAKTTDAPAKPATEPASIATAGAPAAQPLQAAAPAAKPAAMTADLSGWLILNGYTDRGTFDSYELPRYAVPGSDANADNASGMAARQSRLRLALGFPGADGLLGGATLKGLVEADFAGGFVGGNESVPLPRLRIAVVGTTWKSLGNLTVKVGQDWGLLEGNGAGVFAVSLGHIATPRFAAAGQLYRRAPQARLEGEIPVASGLGLVYQGAALANMDTEVSDSTAKSSTFTPSPGVATPAGERSGLPDLEARGAAFFKLEGKKLAEVGVSGHYGEDRFILDAISAATNKTVASKAVALDVKIDVPYLQIIGAGYDGENLGVYASGVPGILRSTANVLYPSTYPVPELAGTKTGEKTLKGVTPVHVQGGFAQVVVGPVANIQLLLGGGIEHADRGDVDSSFKYFRNGQLTGGVIYNITSKWRAELEYTRYVTHAVDNKRFENSQLELSMQLVL